MERVADQSGENSFRGCFKPPTTKHLVYLPLHDPIWTFFVCCLRLPICFKCYLFVPPGDLLLDCFLSTEIWIFVLC